MNFEPQRRREVQVNREPNEPRASFPLSSLNEERAGVRSLNPLEV
jgi:hypothetical protein